VVSVVAVMPRATPSPQVEREFDSPRPTPRATSLPSPRSPVSAELDPVRRLVEQQGELTVWFGALFLALDRTTDLQVEAVPIEPTFTDEIAEVSLAEGDELCFGREELIPRARVCVGAGCGLVA
jgi:hypothetical protein